MLAVTFHSQWSRVLLAVIIVAATTPSTGQPTSLPTSAPMGAFLAEGSALEALYASARGQGWFTKTHWMDRTKHVCNWHGVACRQEGVDGGGTVTKLELVDNNLANTLPSELGRLTNVAQLYVQSNHFTASIPSEIGNLGNLGLFDASKNSLSAAIPSEIGSIGSSLDTLILKDNKLESTLSSSMCNLTNLQIVSLSSNRLRGALPVCPHGFSRLQVLDAAKNNFEGLLPSMKLWPSIRYLLLHANGFKGSLKELDFDYGGNLVTLTLHDNSLTGNIPPDVALPRSLKTLTFANNKLTGRVPRELLEQQRSNNGTTEMTIYATNNRLSCDLPQSWNFTTDQQSLVLIGNRFSWTLPSWVQLIEANSTFLSTVVRVHIRDMSLPAWLTVLLQACVVALLSEPALARYRRDFADPTGRAALVTTAAGDDDDDMTRFLTSPVSRALLSCSYGVAALGASGLVVFFVLFGLGGSFYECGDAFMKYTTAAYVSDAPVIEWLLACGAIIWTGAVGVVMRRFFRHLEDQRQHRQKRHRTPQATAMIPGPDSAATIPTTAVGNEEDEEERRQWHGRAMALLLIRHTGVALCFIAWFLILVVVGGAPTLLYVATYSLPAKNTLGLKEGFAVKALGSTLALYLSLVSGVLIPLVTKPTARAVLAIRAPGSSEGKHHELVSVLGIIARTLVVVVLPVLSVLLPGPPTVPLTGNRQTGAVRNGWPSRSVPGNAGIPLFRPFRLRSLGPRRIPFRSVPPIFTAVRPVPFRSGRFTPVFTAVS